MYQIIVMAWKCSSVYFFWIGVHYLSAHAYPYFCADLSMIGMISSPFLVVAPHCKALSWLQQTSSLAIHNMWIVLGSWLATQLVPNPVIVANPNPSAAPLVSQAK
jgi:hypothetical protein